MVLDLIKHCFCGSHCNINYRHNGSYLFIGREDAWGVKTNSLRIFVMCERYRKGELHDKIYTPLIFNNIIIDENGKINIVYEDGITPEFTTDIENYLSKNEGKYIIEEIVLPNS